MTGRLDEQAARPLGDRERRWLLAFAIAVILSTSALLLTLPPAAPRPAPTSAPPLAAGASANRPTPPRRQRQLREVEATALRFLRGYLVFVYGRGPAAGVEAATGRLRRRLGRGRLRVSPATLRRHPRVVEIGLLRLRDGRFVVKAEIADGGPARYAIELTVSRRNVGWRVSGVADH